MWQYAVQSVIDFYKFAQSSSEQRAQFSDTVSKLRHLPRKSTANAGYWPMNPSAEAREERHEPSLLNTLGSAVHKLKERKAAGHWFNISCPAIRDKRIVNLERSYHEVDYPGLGFDEANFESFLTNSAKKHAIETYILKNRYSVDPMAEETAPSPLVEEFPALNAPPLSETDEQLLRLAESENDSVRAGVAANEAAPSAAMWLLAEDHSTDVKLALVNNSSSPVAILERLSVDFDGKVARKAQARLRRMFKGEVGIASGNLSADNKLEEENDSTDSLGNTIAV